MEFREDGLMVDYSGGIDNTGRRQAVYNPVQERELGAFDQETRLVRAMNELRPYTPSKTQWRAMSEGQRDAFRLFRENVFRKHQLKPTEFNM